MNLSIEPNITLCIIIGRVSVRKRDDGDLGNMPINKLLEILREEEI